MGATYNCVNYRDIPTPYFRVGGVWLPFSITNQPVSAGSTTCTFGFVKNTSSFDGKTIGSGSPYWILGKNFQKDYYIEHDMTLKTMRWAPRVSSNTPYLWPGTQPEEPAANGYLWLWIIFFILVVGLIVFSFFMYFCEWMNAKFTGVFGSGTTSLKKKAFSKDFPFKKSKTKKSVEERTEEHQLIILA
jgi:hypothetical protein